MGTPMTGAAIGEAELVEGAPVAVHGQGKQPEEITKSARIMKPTTDPNFAAISKSMRACMQCGSCTGSCSSCAGMDLTPRQLWRMVQAGMKKEIFESRTFWLCSSCYFCTLRCPRGLPLTENMAALKRVSIAQGLCHDRKSPAFYSSFMDSVRKHGRVREAEMMAVYFLRVRNPLVPMKFTALGIKLMMKGKISPQVPRFGPGKLDGLFRKIEELEGRS
jgi:heterodisulfide reductase subunit C2